MKTAVVATILSLTATSLPALAADAPPARDAASPAAPVERPPAPKKNMKMKAKKPMQMDAPMKTPMAKEGMTMGEVKAGAAKKDAEMGEMMKQEERQMPAAGN